MSNIKIDLASVFSNLSEEVYSVIKLPPEFPDYSVGSDLDIFCFDIEQIAGIIITTLPKNIDLSITKKTSQMYVDIMDGAEGIHIRFDLYQALPLYKNLLVKEAYFSSVLESSEFVKKGGCSVRVPSRIDDALLRYIEYQEWYGRRPDKIKHIKYIEHCIINDGLDVKSIFDKLHYYTALPPVQQERKVSSNTILRLLKQIRSISMSVFAAVRTQGYKYTFNKICRKFF